MRSETVFVALYEEDGSVAAFLGVFSNVKAAKRRASDHFARYHPGEPHWQDHPWGAEAPHDRARYLIRELEVIDH